MYFFCQLSRAQATVKVSISNTRSWWSVVGAPQWIQDWRGLQVHPGLIPSSERCVHRSSSTGGALTLQILCIHWKIQVNLPWNQWTGFTQFYDLILPVAIQVVLELSKIKFYPIFCYLPFFAWFICQHKFSYRCLWGIHPPPEESLLLLGNILLWVLPYRIVLV